MNAKSSLIVGASIIIGSIIIGLMLRTSQTRSPASETGRYQIVGMPGHAFILDTATGRAWEKFAPEGSFQTSKFHRIVVQQSEPLLGDVSDTEAVSEMLAERQKASEDQAKESRADTDK